MSMVPSSPNLPSVGIEGLEDFDMSVDAVMPTLRIEHADAVFKDSLSGETFTEIEVVLLGLVKQRVLWDAEMEEDGKAPLCKSYDFNVGHPDASRFPWQSSGFDKSADEKPTLPCTNCQLKEWGTHPNRDVSWCSAQYTFPLLRNAGVNPETGEPVWVPALLTFQRSSIKPSNTYLSSFVNEGRPLYTVHTKISLEAKRKGTVRYAVPELSRTTPTEQEAWQSYATKFRQIRDGIQRPRGDDRNATDPVTDAEPASEPVAPPTAPKPAPAPTPAPEPAPAPAPAPAPVTAEVEDDDDLPF